MSWTLNTNFAGITAMGGAAQTPEEGAYVVLISKTEAKDSKNQPGLVNIKVSATVEETGYEVSDIFPLPNGMDAKKDRIFLAKWKTLLTSIGYDASQLDTNVAISEEWLLNRQAYVYFVPRRAGEKGSFDDTQFITSDRYEAVKQGKWKPRVAAQSAAPEMAAPVVPAAPAMAPAMATPAPAFKAAAPVPTPPAPPKAGGALGRLLG